LLLSISATCWFDCDKAFSALTLARMFRFHRSDLYRVLSRCAISWYGARCSGVSSRHMRAVSREASTNDLPPLPPLLRDCCCLFSDMKKM
jgi:hypothetical protein